LDGMTDPAQITRELEKEIQVIEREHHAAVSVLTKTADALPGFGIVAAVLGIVITMGAIDGPASEIGPKVAPAPLRPFPRPLLCRSFLAFLLSSGFSPRLGVPMEFRATAEIPFMQSITQAGVALSAGDNPRDVIARARRVVGTDTRPSLGEMADLAKATSTAA